jgi:hypothetical protein
MDRPPLRSASLLLACTALGCTQPLVAETPELRDADAQIETCKVARDPLHPFIVEWPATEKTALEAAYGRGAVVVSYAGCNLKLLGRCRAAGAYTLTSTTPARDVLEMRTETELYAKLPIGAAGLKGEVAAGSMLTLSYVAVGQLSLGASPTRLEGECEGATHYVETLTMGAYALDARAKVAADAAVDVGVATAGADRSEQVKRLKSQGDVDRCAAEPTKGDCGAVLQLGLAPLARAAAAQPAVALAPPAAAAGFHCFRVDTESSRWPSCKATADECETFVAAPSSKPGAKIAYDCTPVSEAWCFQHSMPNAAGGSFPPQWECTRTEEECAEKAADISRVGNTIERRCKRWNRYPPATAAP